MGLSWYWFDSSGWMATGWQRVGSAWYWFDASGAMATSQWAGAYYVGADGKWVPGYGQAPATPASDFEYTIGDFELDGEIRTGSLLQAIEQKPGYCGEVARYGNYYEDNYGSVNSDEGNYATDGSGDSYAGGGSGGNILGFDCGYGVYITGYKGSSSTIVLPEKIDGVDVVYADLLDLDAPEGQVIGVSRCSSLKSLMAFAPRSVNFGSVRGIQSLCFQTGYLLSDLGMKPLDNLAFLHFQGEFPQSFTFGSVASLELLGDIGPSSLNLEGATSLRSLRTNSGSLTEATLNLSGCTSLEKVSLVNNWLTTFPASQFPNLKFLDLSGNPLTSISRAQLEAWATQGGSRLLLF